MGTTFFHSLGVPHLHVCTRWCRTLGVSRQSASRNGVDGLEFFRVSNTSPFIKQGPCAQALPLASGSWLLAPPLI